MKKKRNGKTLGEIFLSMNKTKNPVTRYVYREIMANRLDRIEEDSKS
jgi:hypothetical protein